MTSDLPRSFFSRLRPALVALRRSFSLPARSARPRAFATTLPPTVATTVTGPAAPTVTVIGTPLRSDAARSVRASAAVGGAEVVGGAPPATGGGVPPPATGGASPPPGGGGPAGGVAAVDAPIEGISPVGEITTGGLERLQVEMSAEGNQTGVPATTTPRSSFHAIIVPSWEIDGSCASPCAGRKQSLPSAGGGAPSEANGIIAIFRWPTSPASTAT